MYKNLNPWALSITGRQSEVIELTLTYGYGGFDLDIMAFQHQVESHGIEHASRFLKSAPIRIGPMDLELNWNLDEDGFKQQIEELKPLFETAKGLGIDACRLTVLPATDHRPYHENFEFHRQRLAELAEILATYNLRLGLAFLAPSHHRADRQYQFIASPDALITLMKTTVAENLGIIVDLWHWRVAGGTVEQLRDLSAKQIVEVRVADLPADADLESITETDRLMPLATGTIDTVPFISLLKELGYEGPVTPYPHPDQFSGQKREDVVRLAADATDQIISGEPVVIVDEDSDDSDESAESSDDLAEADVSTTS